MKTKLVLGLILIVLFVSGCSQVSLRDLETITLQECLSKSGQSVATTLNQDRNFVVQNCTENNDFAGIIEFSENPMICCIPNQSLSNPIAPELQAQCSSNSDCNDNNACTEDTCMQEIPAQCSHSQITVCESNDGCCPPSCNHESDTDCKPIDLCQKDSDCDDKNSLTKDTCSGNPKTCSNTLKTCSELGGKICANSQQCSSAIKTSDTYACCIGTCSNPVEVNPCSNITCSNNQKCVNGICVLKNCAELGGNFCTGLQYWSEPLF